MPRLQRPRPVRMAVLGTVAWVTSMMVAPVGRIESLIILSPLVIHPLILRLCDTEARSPKLHSVVSWLQLPAAVSLVVAFQLAPSTSALLLSLPWLLVTACTALLGLLRIREHGLRDLPQLSMSAGLCFVAIGGAWASSAALGYRPINFSTTIVFLTAAHFHYAGFVLPVIAGLVTTRTKSMLTAWIPVAVLGGVPLVAVGITGSPVVEVAGSILLAAGGAATAAGQLYVARRAESAVSTLLLAISALALLWGMALASIYAVSEFTGNAWPSIGEMVHLHGTVNALGFGLLGTWAWITHTGAAPVSPQEDR